MVTYIVLLGIKDTLKNYNISIDAFFSRQPLVKGERLVRLEMNAGYRCTMQKTMQQSTAMAAGT